MTIPRWLGAIRRSHLKMSLLVMLFAIVTSALTSGAVILIGKQGEDWFLVPTNQTLRSAGTVTVLDERPVDLALRPDGTQLAVMTTSMTFLLNATTGEVMQQFDKQDRNVAGLAWSPDGGHLYYAKGKDDKIGVVSVDASGKATFERDIDSGAKTWPAGLSVSPDGTTLYVANGGNNGIAVIALDARAQPAGGNTDTTNVPPTSAIVGFIPVEWYSVGVVISNDGKRLAVANNKGKGSLGTPARPIANGGKSVLSVTGSVTFVDVPTADQLAAYTAQFEENNRYDAALTDALQPPRPDTVPVPIPARIGEPSVFKHVFYVIKENRSYDQVFRDMSRGNGEPKLVHFPRNVSPNHHALADRFGLLDNYYASSVNSADGHLWTDEAVANVFAERVYGFFPTNSAIPGVISYGNNSLDLPPDSLWSNALNHNVSLRNYGEDGINTVTADGQEIRKLNWGEIYRDWRDKTGRFTFIANALTPPLLATEDHAYPAFETAITDQIRVDEWQREFDLYVQNGNLPQLSVIWLPDDHTSGMAPARRRRARRSRTTIWRSVGSLTT